MRAWSQVMVGNSDRIREFLRERGIRLHGLAQGCGPTAPSVWEHVMRRANAATERVAGHSFRTLEAIFERLVERLSLSESMPVLLNVAEFGGAWVAIDLLEHRGLFGDSAFIPRSLASFLPRRSRECCWP